MCVTIITCYLLLIKVCILNIFNLQLHNYQQIFMVIAIYIILSPIQLLEKLQYRILQIELVFINSILMFL